MRLADKSNIPVDDLVENQTNFPAAADIVYIFDIWFILNIAQDQIHIESKSDRKVFAPSESKIESKMIQIDSPD
jgi:hypothetical protein